MLCHYLAGGGGGGGGTDPSGFAMDVELLQIDIRAVELGARGVAMEAMRV